MKHMNRAEIESLYLYYFNQFLSIECFSEYLNESYDYTSRLLNIGRKLNDRRSKDYKRKGA